MKSFIKTIRLLNAGFLLGIAFTMWIMGDEEKEKETGRKVYGPNDPVWANTNLSSKMDDIYNNYKEKQNA